MKLKPGILQVAAVTCFGVGLIYALGIEGGAQVGQPISDGEFMTAMTLILLSIALGRLSFALEDRQTKRKIHKQPTNTVKAKSSRRKAG